MLTEIEQKLLYKVLKEEPFSELEIELMNRMLYLDEEIRHEVDKRNEVEEQLADLFKETRKNMKEVKKMNGLTKQIVINKVIEEVDEARGNAERGQLLNEIDYGTLFGEVSTLKCLELITEAEGIKLLNDVNFAYVGIREGE